MDNVACYGSEDKLIECSYNSDTTEDTHDDDIWIDCSSDELNHNEDNPTIIYYNAENIASVMNLTVAPAVNAALVVAVIAIVIVIVLVLVVLIQYICRKKQTG